MGIVRRNMMMGIVLFFSTLLLPALAQTSATATFIASVNIIEPIQIETTSHMNFADVDAQAGGKVVLNPDNSRSAMGGAILKNNSTASAATFIVKGQAGQAFSIIIPTSEYKMYNGNKEIILKNFQSQIETGDSKEGVQIIRLGATLELEPNQEPGMYVSSAPLAVTVSYN
jgi:hypothetical protein